VDIESWEYGGEMGDWAKNAVEVGMRAIGRLMETAFYGNTLLIGFAIGD